MSYPKPGGRAPRAPQVRTGQSPAASFHQTLARDLDRIAGADLGPGEPVRFTSADGAVSAVMRGFFDEPGTEVTPGTAQAPVISSAPVLHMPESELAGVLDRPLARLDRFEIRGTVYTVQRPMPDGFGLIRIALHKAAPPAGGTQTGGVPHA